MVKFMTDDRFMGIKATWTVIGWVSIGPDVVGHEEFRKMLNREPIVLKSPRL